MELFINCLIILILVGLNAFFVSVEFASVASRRTRIDILADGGNETAKIVQAWLENPLARDRMIAAAQLGVTLVSLALGAVGENTFEALLDPFFRNLAVPPAWNFLETIFPVLPLVISLVIITSIHVILGEQVPKVATIHDPERSALLAAKPMQLFETVFKWFIDILDWSTRGLLKLFGLSMVGEHLTVYTIEEIKQILEDSEESGVIQTPEREMLDAIFDLGDLMVRQVMVPRTEIIAVEADLPLHEIIGLVNESTYTKLPVYDDNLDQILGIVHVKDILNAIQSPEQRTTTARSLVREALYVPETLTVSNLLQRFRDQHQHIAIVLDEYGGTAGLVTLEDLLEEIVGEVSDPFDKVTPEIQFQPDGSILVDGRALIDDVNQQLNLSLSDPNYDTIAGYILGKLGHIPKPHDMIEGDGVRVRVEAMDGLRIASLSLKRLN